VKQPQPGVVPAFVILACLAALLALMVWELFA